MIEIRFQLTVGSPIIPLKKLYMDSVATSSRVSRRSTFHQVSTPNILADIDSNNYISRNSNMSKPHSSSMHRRRLSLVASATNSLGSPQLSADHLAKQQQQQQQQQQLLQQQQRQQQQQLLQQRQQRQQRQQQQQQQQHQQQQYQQQQQKSIQRHYTDPTNSTSNKRRKSSINVSDLVQQSVNRMSLLNTKKASIVPTTQTTPSSHSGNRNKRYSINEVPSSSSKRQSSVLPSSLPVIPKDPRPLRDKAFQNLMQQEIFSFLEVNKFDIEMKYSLTIRSLKSPTQKEFNLIFQFLFKMIDPGYVFLKSIDQEIYQLLKIIEYPYLESVNKSQISAVGGSNWPTFLGLLYWLVNLVQNLNLSDQLMLNQSDQIDDVELPNLSDDELLNENEINNIVDQITYPETKRIDYLFTKLCNQGYKDFLSNKPNSFENHLAKVPEEIDELSDRLIKKVEDTNKHVTELNTQLNELSKDQLDYNKQVEKFNIITKDVHKLTKFISIQNDKKSKWPTTIQRLNEDIGGIRSRKVELENEILKDTEALQALGYTIESIDKLNQKRDKISRDIDLTNGKTEEVLARVEAKQVVFNRLFNELNELINRYNSAVFQLSSSTLILKLKEINYGADKFNYDFNYEIKFKFKNKDELFGLTRAQIVTEYADNEIKINLLSLKDNIIINYINEYQDNLIKLIEQVDGISENRDALEDSLNEKALILKRIDGDNKEIKEGLMDDISDKKKSIEAIEKEIKKINMKKREKLKSTNEQYQIELETLQRFKKDLNNRNFNLSIEYTTIIDQITTLKLTNQANIDDCTDFIRKNLESLKSIE